MEEIKKLIEEINCIFEEFNENIDKTISNKYCKVCTRRARKSSIKLEKLLKNFRQKTIKFEKGE